ncbi:hypothetical protein GCM10028832_22810 [Streptomyces sparsus]
MAGHSPAVSTGVPSTQATREAGGGGGTPVGRSRTPGAYRTAPPERAVREPRYAGSSTLAPSAGSFSMKFS